MKNKYIKLFEDIDWEEWDYEEENPFLDEFIDHENFYEFLKENNCLDQWIEEMNKFGKDIEKFLNYCKGCKISFSSYISLSFTWAKTKQKISFWNKIWKKGLYKYE